MINNKSQYINKGYLKNMIKKISFTLLSLLIVLFIIPFFINVNSYKAPLLALVKEHTGIIVRIDGDIKLSLLPMPHLNITDVAVENKTKKVSNDFVHLKKISLSIKWLPLLKKSLHIHHIELTEPTLFIDKYTDGTINAVAFTEDSSPQTIIPLPQKNAAFAGSPSAHQTIMLNVAKAKIVGGIVHYVDYTTQKKLDVKDINADGYFNAAKGFNLKGRAVSGDNAATISVKGGALLKGLPSIVEATINLDSTNTADHIRGTLSLNTTQKDGVFSGTIASNTLKIPVKIALGDQLINLEDGVRFSANLIANSQRIDLVAFKALIGDDMALSGKGTFTFNNKNAHASITISSKAMSATGKFDVDLSKDKPFIMGTIHMPALIHKTTKDNALSGHPQQTIDASDDNKALNKERWPKDPIDLSALKKINGDFSILVDTALYNDTKLTQTRLAFKLFNGVATITDLSTKVYGGTLTSSGVINAQTNHMAFKTHINDIRMADIPGVKGSPLKKGALTVSADMTSALSSIYNLINYLSGTIKINITDGAIEGFDIKQFIADLKQAKDIGGLAKLKTSFERKANMHFNHIHGDFKIENGIAQTNNFELDSNEGTVINHGSVDLPHWILEITSQIKIHNFNKAPYIMAHTKGAIDQPHFSIDMNQLQELLAKALANQLIDRSKDKVKSQIKEHVRDQVKKKVGNNLTKKLGRLLPGLLSGH